MTPKSVLAEADQSERGLRRVRVGIVVFWLASLTLAVLVVLYLQRIDSSRANQRLDRLEQNELPAKSAYRDAQIEKERLAICTALSREPQSSDVVSAEHTLTCSSKTSPSSSPAAGKSSATKPSASSNVTTRPSASSSAGAHPNTSTSISTRTATATATRTAAGPTVTVRPSAPRTSSTPAPSTSAPCLLGLVCLHLR